MALHRLTEHLSIQFLNIRLFVQIDNEFTIRCIAFAWTSSITCIIFSFSSMICMHFFFFSGVFSSETHLSKNEIKKSRPIRIFENFRKERSEFAWNKTGTHIWVCSACDKLCVFFPSEFIFQISVRFYVFGMYVKFFTVCSKFLISVCWRLYFRRLSLWIRRNFHIYKYFKTELLIT